MKFYCNKELKMKKIIVNRNDAGQRLDKFLTKYLVNIPRSMLYKSLRRNCVRVNGAHVRDGGHALKEGDELSLYFKDEFFPPDSGFIPYRDDIDIIYEDENIILINKPAGLVVHADDRGTNDTLLRRMQSYLYGKGEYNPLTEHYFAPSFCNRLDRNTSGIIIGAKNAEALRIINEKIRSREVKKLYLCIVEGRMTGSKTLTAQLERLEKKVRVTDFAAAGSGAVSLSYTVLGSRAGQSLLEINLETGRTHQIRAQLSHIGHPLRGDKKYGARSSSAVCLTSYKLRFDFVTDAGALNYLAGKEFQISVDFAGAFSQQKV